MNLPKMPKDATPEKAIELHNKLVGELERLLIGIEKRLRGIEDGIKMERKW